MPVVHALLVAAHPDDEVLGAGAQLPAIPGVNLVHVTDGAPRNLHDARAAGFRTRAAYAAARRAELFQALELADIDPPRCRMLELADQEASFSLRWLTERLAELFLEDRPEVVFSHPYEGGHPDHDATAFAVHAACRLIARGGRRPPRIVEFTGYHARGDTMCTGEFLRRAETPILTLPLTENQRALKLRMLGCFITQARTLQNFGTTQERFRVAPRYRFTASPHPGRLLYEHFDWGMDGAQWRGHARTALQELELEEPL